MGRREQFVYSLALGAIFIFLLILCLALAFWLGGISKTSLLGGTTAAIILTLHCWLVGKLNLSTELSYGTKSLV